MGNWISWFVVSTTGSILLAAAVAIGQEGGHLTIDTPAKLSPAVAQSIYENMANELAEGYSAADHVAAKEYLNWERHNTFPYLSATHGSRYINNYANAAASDYPELEAGETIPLGAIIAKDSFTVTERQAVFAAALFVMEKLEEGRSPDTGDWRYLMIMPDGSVFGDSMGVRAAAVAYCHGCHAVAEKNDFLFGVPADYRR